MLLNTAMHNTKLAFLAKWNTFSHPVNINKFYSLLNIVVY